MMGLIGRKIGMTQVFSETGERIAVTAVEAGPNVVMATRTPEKNGYAAIQLGFDDKPLRLATKPVLGALAKSELKPKRLVRELRLAASAVAEYQVGKELGVADVFKSGDWIDVTGTTKGKGTQGVMKRHHMAGFRATHGTHEFFRHGGSVGCRLTPGKVHKGKRMGGRMGNARRTTQNLRVVQVLAEKQILLIQGTVPGGKNGYVLIRGAVKQKKPQA
ncbi:MAG TPA: 50S ribosomal protein L3 [Polyangia bacterium]